MRDGISSLTKVLAAAAIWLFMAAPGWADLIITGDIGGATVAAGGTADINFYISSNAAPITPDQLASFNLQLNITPVAASGLLQFSPVASQPVGFLSNSNYVFATNSLDASPPPSPFWNTVTTTNTANDTISGGDAVLGTATSLSTSTSRFLLATAQIDATNAAAGDTYLVSLVPTSGPQDPNGDPTYFSLDQFDDNPIPFTSTPTTVTVEPSAQATPEPTSLMLAGIGGLSSLVYSWSKRRKMKALTARIA